MVACTPHRLALLLCLLASMPGSSGAEQLPIRTYTTADGLGSDTVFRVVADSRGLLWFCAADGLSRFDGYTFTTYTTRDGLCDRRASDVCETRDGEMWAATRGGLCRFDPRGPADGPRFVRVPIGDDPKADGVNVLVATRDGALWCGTTAGLFRLEERDGAWSASHVDLGTPDGVAALAADPRGGVWAATLGDVRLVRPDGRVEARPLAGPGPRRISSLFVDSGGALWVGTTDGIYRSAADGSACEPVAGSGAGGGAPTGWGNAFFESRDGTMWVATTEGLWRASGANRSAFVRRTTLDGACEREVWDVAEDRDGNLWLATTCGALRIDRYGFTTYTKADGLASSVVDSIFESNAGDLVVTTNHSRRVVHRFDRASFSPVVPNLPLPTYDGWGWGQTVIQDHEGAWWAPTGRGVYRYPKADRPEDAMRARPKAIYTGTEVFRVYEDSRGDVWLATLGPPGLLRWDRATARVVDLTPETGTLPSAYYSTFCEDRGGAVWIGTVGDGLLRYANGRFERFAAGDGAPAGWVRALYVDRAGRLWIASGPDGLARVDDPDAARPSFSHYTTGEGLSSDDVWSVTEDAWGRIYAGTARGVDRIDLATGHVKHYTSADGLPKSQPQCAFRDRDGALWFGSAFGLARLDPEPDRVREPPSTLVMGLRVAGVARPVSALGEETLAPLDLGPDENSVSLDFVGLGTSLGEELRYQYELEGVDTAWSAPSAERAVTFANLGPGTYRFLVRAVDADGVASASPAAFAFTIAAPVWRRWWFVTLASCALGLGAYGGYRVRVRRLLDIERVRTRIATDLHDDIGANLTRIAVLSEVARNARGDGRTTSDQLASIAQISRESVASMSDIVWAINPTKDSLEDMVRRMRRFAGEACASRGVELEFHAPEHELEIRLDHDTRRQLFLVFKESVTNVVRHADCARAKVDLRVVGRTLVLAVADDGRGFDQAASSEGNGLENMRRRAAALGGGLELDSAVGGGTRVRITVPFRAAARPRRPVPMDR
jgi:ligand-binding sensor domain-containing protein/two-component sensor histidine kinase